MCLLLIPGGGGRVVPAGQHWRLRRSPGKRAGWSMRGGRQLRWVIFSERGGAWARLGPLAGSPGLGTGVSQGTAPYLARIELPATHANELSENKNGEGWVGGAQGAVGYGSSSIISLVRSCRIICTPVLAGCYIINRASSRMSPD